MKLLNRVSKIVYLDKQRIILICLIAMENSSIRVLLVDDHTLMREGVASLLRSSSGIEVVGGLSSGEEAVNTFNNYKPHVILMDIMMGGMNGLEATRWI